ncbi:MAG: M1 family metallopeptidase [Chitinophagaceae bacterium]
MTKMVPILVCLLQGFFSYSQSNIDVQHYKYEIELSDQSDSIKGNATIIVKFLQESDNLSFDFMAINKDKSSMFVSLSTGPNKTAILSKSVKDKLSIRLNYKAKAGDIETFIIEYKGIPFDGLIISRNKFGQRTFFSDNWPNRARYWIPCVDELTDKASVEFIVTAPSHYQVVSNGLLMEETNLVNNKKLTHWKEDMPIPTKVMVIGAADFAVNYPGEVNCIPVSTWVFPENKKDGFFDYAAAKEILSFFIDYIGPYPYKKLANVQSLTIFGGMENASAIFYAENSITGRQDHLELIAHEIVHQWFGNTATEKSFSHVWLSEGFATYLATIYIGKKYGADSAQSARSKDRREVIDFCRNFNRPVIDSVSQGMEVLNANSYQKGGWILHMLRTQLGDAAFQKAVQAYYTAYAGKNADTDDLQQIFEKISGKNLSVFFRQWLYTPGIPNLDIKWKYLAKEQKVMVTVKQLQKTLFQFPLELGIQSTSTKNQIQTVQVNQSTQSYSFPAKEKPAQIKIDPSVNFLFEGTISETK